MLHIAALGFNGDDAIILEHRGHQRIARVAEADLCIGGERDGLGIAAQLGAAIGAGADHAIGWDDITTGHRAPVAVHLLHHAAAQAFDGPIGRRSGQNGRKQDHEGKPELHFYHRWASDQAPTLPQAGCQGLTRRAHFRSTAERNLGTVKQ